MSDGPAEPPQIAAIRQRFAESLWLDTNNLEQGLAKVESSMLATALLDELRHTAHRLVGRLGLFGYTQPCAEAELFGDALFPPNPDAACVLQTGRVLVRTLRGLTV